MSAGQYDITIEQGTTVRIPFVWKDETGEVVNLTGYKARMQARRSISSASPVIDATTENGLLLIEPEQGRIWLDIPATTTATFDWPRARYDLEVESASGVVTRLLQGQITLSKEVTR